jgi:hypothetical protein
MQIKYSSVVSVSQFIPHVYNFLAMKVFVFLIFIASVSAQSFDEIRLQFNVQFPSFFDEIVARGIFEANRLLVLAHNANPLYSWKMAFNRFIFIDPKIFIATRCQTREPTSRALPVTTVCTTLKTLHLVLKNKVIY